MPIPRISIRSRYHGQSVVEALLVGPIIIVILLAATRVGKYFYSLSTSESLGYTNAVTNSTTGSFGPNGRQVSESLRYWDGGNLKYLPSSYVPGAPSVFPGHCNATYTIFLSDLGFIDWDPATPNPPLGSFFSTDLQVFSVSISFRPLYGGSSAPPCNTPFSILFETG